MAIIGGGPAGSTTASLLKKYNPRLAVELFEREKFFPFGVTSRFLSSFFSVNQGCRKSWR